MRRSVMSESAVRVVKRLREEYPEVYKKLKRSPTAGKPPLPKELLGKMTKEAKALAKGVEITTPYSKNMFLVRARVYWEEGDSAYAEVLGFEPSPHASATAMRNLVPLLWESTYGGGSNVDDVAETVVWDSKTFAAFDKRIKTYCDKLGELEKDHDFNFDRDIGVYDQG
jgi:hypothetical protein